jgi:hypothetical protein
MEDPMKKVYFVAGDYAFTLQWGGVIRQGVVDVYAGLIDLADRKREVVTYVRTYPGTIGGVIAQVKKDVEDGIMEELLKEAQNHEIVFTG